MVYKKFSVKKFAVLVVIVVNYEMRGVWYRFYSFPTEELGIKYTQSRNILILQKT